MNKKTLEEKVFPVFVKQNWKSLSQESDQHQEDSKANKPKKKSSKEKLWKW